METTMTGRARFPKDGPKRLRRSRRELPEGQISQWAHCITNFKRERENQRLADIDAAQSN